MKKLMVLFMALIMIFTLAACGKKSGGDLSAPSSPPAEASNTPSGEPEKEEIKVYGIGEAAEANGLSITIDKVALPDPDIFIYGPGDGFAFMQVYYTFKNVSDETIETPRKSSIYIVYKDGPTGDDCDLGAQGNSDILPGKKEGEYKSNIKLAPRESTSGWMMYKRPSDKSEVIMHYYSKFINVPPDLVFGFTVE